MNDELTGSSISEPDPATEIARLFNEGSKLQERGLLFESAFRLRHALELAESLSERDDLWIAGILSQLGTLERTRSNCDDSEVYYRRALAIQESLMGPAHPETLQTAIGLANALYDSNRNYEEADALAVRAITAFDAEGRDDSQLAEWISTVGWMRYFCGRYADAEPMLLRALAMQQRLLGEGNAATANTARSLAMLYNRGKLDNDAEPYYRKALAGFESELGTVHSRTLDILARLAGHLEKKGRHNESTLHFEDLASRIVSAKSSDIPDWDLWGACQCSHHFRERGRLDVADAIEKWIDAGHFRVVGQRGNVQEAERFHGPESPEFAYELMALAIALKEAGFQDEADEKALRGRAILDARPESDASTNSERADKLAWNWECVRSLGWQFGFEFPLRR